MAVTAPPVFRLDDEFASTLPELCMPWQPAPVSDPRLLAVDAQVADELGIDPGVLASANGLRQLIGLDLPEGAHPVAQAYAGHQFGGYSPRLGDGRALLLGEVTDVAGAKRDVHLKGSGRTPFSRGGDGLAAVGPMLRELIVSEAMHALGIPTTRSLAVVGTGDLVRRELPLPGAVLVRVASSHLRVGTFQYAAATGDVELLRRLTDYAIARHHPQAADDERPALALLDAVVGAQAELVAQWMLVGFVHGVMNTDNTTISGETIDYGPCAFMDAFDPATVFSSIDHGGRYAYGNQPPIMLWNLSRLAEALLQVIDEDPQAAVGPATAVLETFAPRYQAAWLAGMRSKLGLLAADTAAADADRADLALANDLLAAVHARRGDHTTVFRLLAEVLRAPGVGLPELESTLLAPVMDVGAATAWLGRWRARLAADGRPASEVARAMDAVNPVHIPRNHLVEEALAAATDGDLAPVESLRAALRQPFRAQPQLARYAQPGTGGAYVTYCGT